MCNLVSRFFLRSQYSASSSCAGGVRNCHGPIAPGATPSRPAIFLAVSGWMLWHLLEDPSTREPSLWGLATALLGLILYYLSPKKAPDEAL